MVDKLEECRKDWKYNGVIRTENVAEDFRLNGFEVKNSSRSMLFYIYWSDPGFQNVAIQIACHLDVVCRRATERSFQFFLKI